MVRWQPRPVQMQLGLRKQRLHHFRRMHRLLSQQMQKGTVDDRTVTGIEEQLNKEGETADSVTKTATEGTKEFYTISTKSGKIFI